MLRRTFYPHHDHKLCTIGKEKQRRTGNKRKRAAMKRGRALDASLDSLVEDPKTRKLIAESRLIREYLQGQGVTPYKTQVEVYIDGIRLGTRLDLVGKDADGKMVIYEVKCGFRGYYEAHSKTPMREPFEHLNDSVRYQHQLQLAYGVDMFIKRNPGVEVALDKCAVLVANETLSVYPLDCKDVYVDDKIFIGYVCMGETATETVKQRSRATSRLRCKARKAARSEKAVRPESRVVPDSLAKIVPPHKRRRKV